jgi:hypothetical protein
MFSNTDDKKTENIQSPIFMIFKQNTETVLTEGKATTGARLPSVVTEEDRKEFAWMTFVNKNVQESIKGKLKKKKVTPAEMMNHSKV